MLERVVALALVSCLTSVPEAEENGSRKIAFSKSLKVILIHSKSLERKLLMLYQKLWRAYHGMKYTKRQRDLELVLLHF